MGKSTIFHGYVSHKQRVTNGVWLDNNKLARTQLPMVDFRYHGKILSQISRRRLTC